jgi:NAD(P)-dependent dehydrogenase (short-subunit alcohol dehydrogenase family)
MSTATPIVLILGSGANVGQHAARAFAEKGYRVALASRSAKEQESTSQQLNISSDFADPKSIYGVFAKVKTSLGLPTVVIYNGIARESSYIKFPLTPRSRIRDTERCEEPPFTFLRWFHARHERQYYQRIRRSAASRRRL